MTGVYRIFQCVMFALVLVGMIHAQENAPLGSADSSATTEKANKGAIVSMSDFRQIPFKTISGKDTSLSGFEGKVVLIVNTASECGYTPQYEGLQKLYETYKDKGLVIIGFPSNDFGGQEPGSNDQIAAFCKLNYGVTFPMMAKVSVKGDTKHPLFSYLTEKSPVPGEIKWNFGKFLIDKQGVLVARFGSSTSPSDSGLVSQIEALLAK